MQYREGGGGLHEHRIEPRGVVAHHDQGFTPLDIGDDPIEPLPPADPKCMNGRNIEFTKW